MIRRRKTARSKTLRGGMKSLKEIREDAKILAGNVGARVGSLTRRGAEYFGTYSAQSPDQAIEPPGPSAEDSEAAKAMAEAAAAEENKANLKKTYDDAMGAYDAAKQNREDVKKNFSNGPEKQKALGDANADASDAYKVALKAARAAAAGGVEKVIYP